MRQVLKTMMLAAVSLSALLLIGLWWMSQKSQLAPTTGASATSDFTRTPEKTPMPPLEGLDWRSQVTLVSFWAAWCAPCLEELPLLDQLAKDQSDLRIVLVNVDTPESESLEQAGEFLRKLGHPAFDHVYAKPGTLDAWGAQSLPVHYIVDANKEIIWHSMGAIDWSSPEVREEIFQLIGIESKTEQEPSAN